MKLHQNPFLSFGDKLYGQTDGDDLPIMLSV